jgi:hypothetical protein
VADQPLEKLLRVLAGVGLSYGPLGHQVLGQLLTLNSKEVEVALASTLVAAASQQRSALAYTAVRVLAPAVAVYLLTRKEETRLAAIWQQLEAKAARLECSETKSDDGAPIHARISRQRTRRGGKS